MMIGDDHSQEREELRRNVEREEVELRAAVEDLKRAVSRPFAALKQANGSPGPWLLAAVIAGVWLGWRDRDPGDL